MTHRAANAMAALVLAHVVASCGGDGATPPARVPTGSFALSVAPVAVLEGGSGESQITIVRNGGFTGSVALVVSGAPAGLSATIEPSFTNGTTATLLVTTLATTVTTGSAALTITGTAAGQSTQAATATVAISPSTAGAGNVTVDFSTCDSRPIWFAFQDGTGAWTQILGSGDVYQFNIASSKGGTAWVNAGSPYLEVSFASQAEMAGAPISRCGVRPGPTKSVSGTIAGRSSGDVVYLGLGGGYANPEEGGPVTTNSFTLTGIRDGVHDLLAFLTNSTGLGERLIIRRDQSIVNNETLRTLDFLGTEAFAPASGAVTVTGAGAGTTGVSHDMWYYTGPDCAEFQLYDQPNSGASFVMRGIPAAQQRATDVHVVGLYFSGSWVYESFHTLADRVIALPAPLPAPTITAPPGGHKRVQASLTLPSEYQAGISLYYSYQGGPQRGFQGGPQRGFLKASFAWLGGATATLAVPDFSAVSGWRSAWMPASSALVNWSFYALGANSAAAGGYCAENARFVGTNVFGRI